MWAIPSPSPRTHMLVPSGSTLAKGCISWIPCVCSTTSARGVPRRRCSEGEGLQDRERYKGVPRRRCSEINRQASSVTPEMKEPALPMLPKTSKGSPFSSVETVT